MAGGPSHSDFKATKRFPQLDGLRTLSILLVLAYHTTDRLWRPIHGYLGVTLFFVLSGFLITTLLLREEDAHGRPSLRNFYIRRLFRIAPLYYLALILYTVLVLGLGLGQGGGDYAGRLPLLATLNGEFAGAGTFNHSWSLGIEEKFYLAWPAVAFGAVLLARLRPYLLLVLLPLAVGASFVPAVSYFGIYGPILAGCAVAVGMHDASGFDRLKHLARTPVAVALWVLLALALLYDQRVWFLRDASSYGHVVFGLIAALALPGLLLGANALRWLLEQRPIVYVGTLAYAIYLFHPLFIEVADRLVGAGQDSLSAQVARFAIVVAGSVVMAAVLAAAVEQPMIRRGRRLTRSPVKPNEVPAATA